VTLAVFAARAADDGLVTRPSKHTVAETTDHLEAGLRQAGATVFAHIDYAQSAHDNGLELNPMVLILFGNPKAGTPLIARSPTIGVDLPLKSLVWQDVRGSIHLVRASSLGPHEGVRAATTNGLVVPASRATKGNDRGKLWLTSDSPEYLQNYVCSCSQNL